MRNLSWPAVVSLAIIAATAVSLGAFTNWGSGEILGICGVLGGIAGGAAAGGAFANGVQDRVDQIHTETANQTPILETVARRVNGELDGRIAAAQEEAAEQGAARAIAALRKQGILP
jgi:hypothetical protein